MEKICVGFIGVGRRAPGLLRTVLVNFPDVDVVAVCDSYPDKAETGRDLVRKWRDCDCKVYTDYKDLLADEKINTVVITAAWEAHVPLAVASMKAGKITALEVGGAYCIEDCWQLVRTYQETKTPFMFLENCCYGKRELLATSLVRHGVFGEVVHCHGAYLHDCRKQIADGIGLRHYRQRNYLYRNGDNYPTHGIGPIAKLMNINRGNRMLSLVSVASKARGMCEYVKDKEDFVHLKDKTWAQGDVVETIITCADGATISLRLDTSLPHPYGREFTVSGTKGCYREDGNLVYEDSMDLNKGEGMSNYYNNAVEYEEKYLPACWKNITKEELESGHGGMDVLLFKAFFDAIKKGDEMPIDVYDAASWMAITCLSEHSVCTGGHPVDIPDFTSGQWLLREPKDIVDFGC